MFHTSRTQLSTPKSDFFGKSIARVSSFNLEVYKAGASSSLPLCRDTDIILPTRHFLQNITEDLMEHRNRKRQKIGQPSQRSNTDLAVLTEIRDNWKLEAKSESSERYFFHVDEVQLIDSGKKSYVIGRKGTGKTAIAEYFYTRAQYNQFCEKLSFKNFPFNELYKLKNEGFTPSNQYITLWKYLIYSFICKLMVKNEAIDFSVRGALEKVFSPEPLSSLARWISRWTPTTTRW